MTINVEITGTTKPYVGLIVGADPTYVFALDFLLTRRVSSRYHKAEITTPGNYKLPPGSVVASRRIDTGYITVTDDGTVTEITIQTAQRLTP